MVPFKCALARRTHSESAVLSWVAGRRSDWPRRVCADARRRACVSVSVSVSVSVCARVLLEVYSESIPVSSGSAIVGYYDEEMECQGSVNGSLPPLPPSPLSSLCLSDRSLSSVPPFLPPCLPAFLQTFDMSRDMNMYSNEWRVWTACVDHSETLKRMSHSPRHTRDL